MATVILIFISSVVVLSLWSGAKLFERVYFLKVLNTHHEVNGVVLVRTLD